MSITHEKKLHNSLIMAIVSGYHPFSIVEEPEFKNFIQTLNPKYSFLSRKTFSNVLLNDLYTRCCDRVKELISVAEVVGLTTDSWTSINNKTFYAVDAHFCDQNLKLTSALLQCEKVDERVIPLKTSSIF